MQATIYRHHLLEALGGHTAESLLVADRDTLTVGSFTRGFPAVIQVPGAYTIAAPRRLRAWLTQHPCEVIHIKRVGINLRFLTDDGEPLEISPTA